MCAVASTFVGAVEWVAVGAVIGAATGSVQGAVEGYQQTGTWEGTLRGMAKGAAKGAVQGAQDGMLSGMVREAFAGAMNPSFCFIAGTAVLIVFGKKEIRLFRCETSHPL